MTFALCVCVCVCVNWRHLQADTTIELPSLAGVSDFGKRGKDLEHNKQLIDVDSR